MTLSTLADVSKLLHHLPEDYRDKSTWRLVADELDKAAAGADLIDVEVALRMVLFMEHIECRTQ
jgi:hypothetical protein